MNPVIFEALTCTMKMNLNMKVEFQALHPFNPFLRLLIEALFNFLDEAYCSHTFPLKQS